MTVLSERQLQVLRYVSHGYSNQEIARHAFMSEDTVKTHLRRVFETLGAFDRAHAVGLGFEAGLLTGADRGRVRPPTPKRPKQVAS